MMNPWHALENCNNGFVADCDKEYITSFNSKYKGTDYEIRCELPPEPFIGNANAQLVLLGLNPGYSENDYKFMLHNKAFAESMKNTRLQNEHDYPFYHLNPIYFDNPDLVYWKSKLKPILNFTTMQNLANSILLLEYFPYKSKKFKGCKITQSIPSQKYTYNLLQNAINRGAIIICLRSKRYWQKAVPELENYSKLHFCKNPRNPVLSINNLGEIAFNDILNVLKSASPVTL